MQLNLNRYLARDAAARTMQLAGMLRFVCIFLQGIILVKAGVPLVTVGKIELVFFLVNFFQFFWQTGGHQAMMAWKSGAERQVATGDIYVGMHLQAAAGTILLLCAALIPMQIGTEVLLGGINLLWLALYVFFSIPVGAVVYAFLVRKQYKGILWYTGVAQLLQVVVVLVVILAGGTIEDLILALAIYAIARWLVVTVIGKWSAQGPPTLKYGWAFFLFAVPLVLHAFYGGVVDYVDGWIVSLFFGEDSFALYRYGARELPLNALLIGGLTTGLVHQFKSGSRVDTATMKMETGRIIRFLLPLNCLLVLVSPLVYTLIYSEDFVLSARIFNIYVLTLLSRVVLNQVFCYVHHANWVLAWSTAAEIVINIILSIILLQWIGLLGIPVATVVAYALQKIFLIIYVQRRYGIPLGQYVPIRTAGWYIVALVACTLAAEIIYF